MARKTELNSRLQQRLCDVLASCNTISTACAACGISDRTFYNWMKRGEDEKGGLFFQFLQSVTRARAGAKIKLVERILMSAPKDWRAAAFLLERMYPSEYGRRVQDSGSSSMLKPTEVRLSISADELEPTKEEIVYLDPPESES